MKKHILLLLLGIWSTNSLAATHTSTYWGIPVSNTQVITQGNPHGNVLLLAFVDWQCPHCRREYAVLQRLQKTYPALQVVFIAIPAFATSAVSSHALQQHLTLFQRLGGRSIPLVFLGGTHDKAPRYRFVGETSFLTLSQAIHALEERQHGR